MTLPSQASMMLSMTREGETVRKYALGLSDPSYFARGATPIFADNVLYDGCMFKVAGGENARALFADFTANRIIEVYILHMSWFETTGVDKIEKASRTRRQKRGKPSHSLDPPLPIGCFVGSREDYVFAACVGEMRHRHEQRRLSNHDKLARSPLPGYKWMDSRPFASIALCVSSRSGQQWQLSLVAFHLGQIFGSELIRPTGDGGSNYRRFVQPPTRPRCTRCAPQPRSAVAPSARGSAGRRSLRASIGYEHGVALNRASGARSPMRYIHDDCRASRGKLLFLM